MARPASSTTDVIDYFIAIFIPPLAVFLKRGCGADLLINICLTILGWIPGLIHAWWIISKHERTRVAHG
ncbi:plasma membrane proteolipid Pmp3 [Diaporthe eres]|uniref:Plasma membrane proteolipid Pmp3 n=1 Tax=Diaporthe eres TaxID=83184 RepID=A0ABR1P5X6_DIAER